MQFVFEMFNTTIKPDYEIEQNLCPLCIGTEPKE